MAAVLPPELTDRVLDHLAEDQHSLRACTLASRALRPRAQHLAFKSLMLACPKARGRLLGVLRTNPTLGTHVETLSVTCWQDAQIALLEDAAFPLLKTLTLRMYRPSEARLAAGDRGAEGRAIKSVTSLVARAPRLTHLKLWDCMLDGADVDALFDACRKQGVARLSVVDCPVFPDASIVAPMEFSHAHFGPLPSPMLRSICAAPSSNLRVLSCTYVGLDGGLGVRALAEVLTGLEHLRVEFNSRDAFSFLRPPALNLAALTSLRTLYVEAILTERYIRHEHYALVAPRLLANILLPPSEPAVTLHVHAAPLPAVHAWVHPIAPTALLLEYHGAEKQDRVKLEHGARQWAARCVARESKMEVIWSPERVPVYGLEEPFMRSYSM